MRRHVRRYLFSRLVHILEKGHNGPSRFMSVTVTFTLVELYSFLSWEKYRKVYTSLRQHAKAAALISNWPANTVI